MVETIFLLFVLFQLKHFFADYPLQNQYMLRKFQKDDWALPLFTHCSVHGVMTLLIVIFFVPIHIASVLAIFDVIIHFVMDRIKASPFILGKYNPTQKAYWNVAGVDQLVHHLTHYTIIAIIVGML